MMDFLVMAIWEYIYHAKTLNINGIKINGIKIKSFFYNSFCCVYRRIGADWL